MKWVEIFVNIKTAIQVGPDPLFRGDETAAVVWRVNGGGTKNCHPN
jgi:hypothetical protein